MSALTESHLRTALELLITGADAAHETSLTPGELRGLRRQLEVITDWHRTGRLTGFGRGSRVTAGVTVAQDACRIYVAAKRPASQIRARERIPRDIVLEGFPAPIPLDVVQLAPPEAASLRDPRRPIFPGLSAGHCTSGETGSMGPLLTTPEQPGVRLLLGACHVFAVSGLARPGDVIIQPGTRHGGRCPRLVVGRLLTYVPFSFDPNVPNDADAALVALHKDLPADPGPDAPVSFATPDSIVAHRTMCARTGCMSGRTPALITELHYAGWVAYPTSRGQAYALFREMLLYTGPALDGDSGGPLVTQDRQLVGIHLGRSPSGVGVGTPIWAVRSHWNISLMGEPV